MRRSVRLWCGATLAVLGAFVLVSCGDDGDTVTEADPEQRLIDIYAATVEAVATEATTLPDSEDDATITVFLQAREDTEIDADVQVGVVTSLEDWANVRFIDDVGEAIDSDSDDASVRDDGLLIGLGPVGDGSARATVTADRYLGQDETIVYDAEVELQAGVWTVVQPLDGVTVRSP